MCRKFTVIVLERIIAFVIIPLLFIFTPVSCGNPDHKSIWTTNKQNNRAVYWSFYDRFQVHYRIIIDASSPASFP